MSEQSKKLNLSEDVRSGLQEMGVGVIIVSAIFLVVPALVIEKKMVSAVLFSLFAALNVPLFIRFVAIYYFDRGLKIIILWFTSLISFIAVFVFYCNYEGILFFN
jgi:hypothetical protein